VNFGYIDTSFLLSILFEDENYKTTVKTWNQLEALYSSQLLEIESRINVYKYCILAKKDENLYKEMEDYLKELLLCTYDRNMIKIGKEMSMKTI